MSMTPQPSISVMESHAPAHAAAHASGSVVNIEQSERELRRQLTRYARWMHRLGFAPGTSGNLSVRLPFSDRFNERRILATPTGCSKALLRPSDMVIVDL